MGAGKSRDKTSKRRIFLVDDHAVMREGLARLIDEEPDLSVCCQAGDVTEAIKMAEGCGADLALVDISLSGRNGIELIKIFGALTPPIPVLVLSMHDESVYAERALRAGARGYVMKSSPPPRLLDAIRTVLSGEVFVSGDVTRNILQRISGIGSGAKVFDPKMLTDREFEVFQLIGQGFGASEIAVRLRLSVKTVEHHRANIKTKLGVETAAELRRNAVRWVSDGLRPGI